MKKKLLLLSVMIVAIIFSLSFVACSDSSSNGELVLETYTYDYIVGEKYKIEWEFSPDDILTPAIDYYDFVFSQNIANASVEWIERNDGSGYYDAYISATDEGIAILKVNYKNYKYYINYSSKDITFNFKYKTITTVEELKSLNNFSFGVKLGANIDLSSESNWTPIEGFSGTLCGGVYSISNLTIDSVNGENLGLFGTLQGTVKDLTIENAQIAARGDAGKAGIVAGTNKGTISNVTVSGNIAPEYYSYVGGIVGYNNLGKIADCTNVATVTGADNVGGIAGSVLVNTNDAITACVNEGTITGKNNVGGIAGYLTCVTSNATYQISNNINKNTVAGDNQVGGIFGYVYAFYQQDGYMSSYSSYFSMSVLTNTAEINGSSTGSNVGGLIGKAVRLTLLTTCENTADVTGGTCVGGYVGYAPDTNIKAAGAKNNNTITGKGKIGGFAGQAGIIENAINNGEIVSTGVIIENSNSRAYVGGIAGYCTGLIGCENNIDITIENSGDYVGGLAGYVVVSKSNCVDNNINYGTITGKNNVGGIAGYLTCVTSNATYQISNNINKNTVAGDNQVGGIFGYVYAFYQQDGYMSSYSSYFSMSVLTNTAEINGSSTGSNVGGLIGKAVRLTLLTTCENTADVTGGTCVGGYVGYAPDTNIKAAGAKNNNTITGKGKIGGFAGQAGIIENAINNGEIVSTGVIIENSNSRAYVGGIAGYCTGLIGCENNIDITIENSGDYVGGLAGYVVVSKSNCVDNNINYGTVTGYNYVGGIVGYLTCVRSNATYQISNNTNKNTVQGNEFVGGIVGYVYGFYQQDGYMSSYSSYFEIVNSTNEAEIVGVEKVGGICGGFNRLKTDANLMDTNTTLYGDKLGQ